jgi:hypothetical protein
MTDRPTAQLTERLGCADEIQISTRRPDDTLRGFVPIWIVAVDGALYVRSYRGANGAWYRHATTASAGPVPTGVVRAGTSQLDVTFDHIDPEQTELLAAIDGAYRDKYARCGDSYLQPMLADPAVAATARLDPHGGHD